MRTIILCLIILQGIIALPATAGNDQPIDPHKALAEADIANGKSIFLTGKRANGAYLSFIAGPNWLHVDGGGCAACHGNRGGGGGTPDFCNSPAPPITYKFLAGDGYPPKLRKSTHPAYTRNDLERMVLHGIMPTGRDADFCMPRWKMSDEDFRDLLGYLIQLDDLR